MRRSLTALPLLLAACLGPGDSAMLNEEQQFDLYSTTAQYLYEDGRLIKAQDQAVKALEIEPDDEPMRRMIGWIRLRMGKNEDLIIAEQFFRALFDDGDDGNATLLGLGTACERLGLAYDEASRSSEKSEREREKNAKRAVAYWAEAREHYERTLTEGEGDTRAMNGLQRVTALQGDLASSLAWSERLLVRAEENLLAWRAMLENSNLSTNDEEVIRKSEREAIDLSVNTHLFAASLLQRTGGLRKAVEHLDETLAHRPDLAEAYSRRAQLRAKLGQNTGAISDIDQYLRLSKHDIDHPDIQAAFDLRRELDG